MAEEKKTDGQAAITNRQRLAERFKGANPDFNVDDDEAMYGEALAGLERGDEAEAQRKRLNETIAGNEIAPEMLNGIISGKNPDGSDFNLEDYLLDQHLDFLLDYLEDSSTAREKRTKREAERAQQKADDEAFQQQMAGLIEAEDAELDAAIAEAGYKPEQVKDLIDWIYDKDNGFIKRARNFELKKDDFLRLFKIKDWDLKMSEAEDKGYKRGRNEKIDMFRRDEGRRGKMPADVGSAGGAPKVEGPKKDPQIAALERMKNAY